MKKLFTICIALFTTATLFAQMPQAINYQAVARNSSGAALASQAIKVKLSILSGAAGNPTLYSETRNVTTNALGLFNIQIGSAGALSTTGNFTGISWANNTPAGKSLKVELDINNSGSFTDMGTQSLVTVPYAFASNEAINAINIGGNYVAATTPNTGDMLKWNGSAWVPGLPTVPAFIGFRAQKTTNTLYTTSFNNQPLIFQTDNGSGNFDSANVYNPATGVFTAPESGMYFLNTNINFYTIGSSVNLTPSISFVSNTNGYLTYSNNNSNVSIIPSTITGGHCTGIFHLTAGEQITVRLYDFSPSVGAPVTIFTESTFQGYKIK